MGDVIAVAGWSLDNFKKNPVFMLSHDHSGLPIGTVPDVRVEGKQLLSAVKFDSGDANAMLVKGKYERGVMRAVSVGFRALSFEERTDQPGTKNPGLLFKESELLEISAVAVPAHPGALRRALAFYSFGKSEPIKQEPKPEPVAPAAFSPEQIEKLRQAIRGITG